MEVALVILDGWGIGNHDRRNAIERATTPTVDELQRTAAVGQLDPTGRRVGLPDGEAGNSEVGHLHIGSGRVVMQAYTRINDDLTTADFRRNRELAGVIDHAAESTGRLHLIGLLSAGGVHADYRHLFALIEWGADSNITVWSHLFTDGRDMPPTSGIDLVRTVEERIEAIGTGNIATITGRYFGMDRDENWERTRRAYDAIVMGIADHRATTASAAVEAAYGRGETDEFIEPTIIDDGATIESGDTVVFINFRGDRGRQLVRMLMNIRPEWNESVDPPEIELITMTEYDRTFPVPVAYPPPTIRETLGEVFENHGLSQLRIAESEKYAHVTYFFNGGREIEFSAEIRRIVPSPDVSTYDSMPEMSADQVTETALDTIGREDPDALVLNYANPDMVGHTGNFDATIRAVESVDRNLGRLLDGIESANCHVIITADHGNADDMGTSDQPHTAHTTNPVPFMYRAPTGDDGGYTVRSGGSLSDIAPTILELLNLEQPDEMTGLSLLAR